MAEGLVIDPTSEDGANVELDLNDGVSFRLLEASYPSPPTTVQWASSADTEGAVSANLKYENREITLKLHVKGATTLELETQLGYLFQKLGKINREGGTLERTAYGSGTRIVFDLLPEASGGVPFDHQYVIRKNGIVDVRFTARPFWRMAARQLSDHVETTLPYLVFTETGIKGDVPALGKLVIDDDQGQDQWWLIWGVQSRYYDSASTAALFFQAESLTPQGGAATAAGPSGASGSGSNTVLQGNLAPLYQSMLSTQASGGGAHMSHVGDFQVLARVQAPTTNTGGVSLRLEWAEGDFRRRTLNSEVALYPDTDNLGAWEGSWRLVDLGQVHLSKVPQGTQRWEGRLLAKSTVAGDDLYVDHLLLIPITEASGRVSAVLQTAGFPTSFGGRDEFDQTAGNLTGKTAPVGGTWGGAGGGGNDFTVNGSGSATRTAVSDAAGLQSGRLEPLGATTYTDVAARVDTTSVGAAIISNPFFQEQGLILRYTSGTDFAAVYVTTAMAGGAGTGYRLVAYKRVAGVTTALGSSNSAPQFDFGSYVTIQAIIDSSGRFVFWAWPYDQPDAIASPLIVGWDSDFATGGGLASGLSGLYDHYTSSSAETRYYDSFATWAPTKDAAVFANQSVEIRHDRVVREDSGGAIWTPVSSNPGDYLTIPPAGREARTARLIVKACRNDPTTGPDSGIDDISARLSVTERGLVVPEV